MTSERQELSKRRGRVNTARNSDVPFSAIERERALSLYYQRHVQQLIPPTMQAWLEVGESVRPADQGTTIGSEMEETEMFDQLRVAFQKGKGQPFTAQALIDRILSGSQLVAARSGREDIARRFTASTADSLADAWGLSNDTREKLKLRVYQQRVPKFS